MTAWKFAEIKETSKRWEMRWLYNKTINLCLIIIFFFTDGEALPEKAHYTRNISPTLGFINIKQSDKYTNP